MREDRATAVATCIAAALVVTWATSDWKLGAAALWMLVAISYLLRIAR